MLSLVGCGQVELTPILNCFVKTYATIILNLTTIAERLNHSVSIQYGYPIGYWYVPLLDQYPFYKSDLPR